MKLGRTVRETPISDPCVATTLCHAASCFDACVRCRCGVHGFISWNTSATEYEATQTSQTACKETSPAALQCNEVEFRHPPLEVQTRPLRSSHPQPHQRSSKLCTHPYGTAKTFVCALLSATDGQDILLVCRGLAVRTSGPIVIRCFAGERSGEMLE